jgi:hypothetical protein
VRGRWRPAAAQHKQHKQHKQQEQQKQQKQQKQKAKVVPQKGPELPRGQLLGGGGDGRAVARGGHDAQLLLLRSAAAAAAVDKSAGRSDALVKAANWPDLSALLPKRAKTVRRAAGRRKKQQQQLLLRRTDVVAGANRGSSHRRGPSTWTTGELRLLHVAVGRHGRDWAPVARRVGSKSRQQCRAKVDVEVAAGRMQEPGGKQLRDSWSKVELGALKRAVALHGRDWDAVARSVLSRTKQQCMNKASLEIAAGRMQEPGGKRVQDSWSKAELGALKRAVALHGRDWPAVARSVRSKTKQQCVAKVYVEVAAGRMQEPGGKRVLDSWSKVELGALKRAVALHGRDWAAVSSSVGSKTIVQCRGKVDAEVAAGRMQEPGGKRVLDSWSKVELGALKRAAALHGRDWVAVASSVGSKSIQQCSHKVATEVAAGRMQEPGGKQVKDSWSKVELGALKRAAALNGRDWAAVARSVRSKTKEQCFRKVAFEVASGRMQEPGGKRVVDSWSKVELGALKRAVALHGRVWDAVASCVGSKTREQCIHKVAVEVAAGRMQEPGGKRVLDLWSRVELGALKRAVALHGRDWAAVARSIGSKTRQQCMNKVATEVAAGRMQEPGGKRVLDLWSRVELGALKRAVALHARDWAAVSSSVGSKSIQQCSHKVATEVAAGRMEEPAGKRVLVS